jgi:Tfp pilus assembly protein PilO
MSSSNRLIVAVLVVIALAVGFWVLLLGPKRNRADELGSQIEGLKVSREEAQTRATQAEAARSEFPSDYRQLVTLGEAVPADDETSSLLVELNRIAERTRVKFDSIQLEGSGEDSQTVTSAEGENVAPPTTGTTGSASATPAAQTVPPTEASASLLPLGARIGPAGLAVMPYSLSFRGNFFHIADFMQELDKLVHTGKSKLTVEGRLTTLDGFALNEDGERPFPYLSASFDLTTYLVPPEQGITAGATPTEPAPATATPAAAPGGEATSEPSSETVSAR